MGFLRCGKRVSYKTGLCRYDSFGPKRVGFGCFPTRFAQVAAAFAVSWACGRCACVRGAWEEGRGGDGVGAMGSCQGVFGVRDWRRRRPRAAPLPWVPAFARTTVGGGVRDARGLVVVEGALRQAQGERILEARLRCGLVGACRRPAHLWIPAFAGTTMAGVGSMERRRRPAPRPCPGFPLSRERRWGERGRLQVLCRVTAPRPSGFLPSHGMAPLGVVRAFDGNDGWRCAGRAGAGGGTGGPFDRLRANGISKRACDVGWWGRAAARRTSGYRLSPE